MRLPIQAVALAAELGRQRAAGRHPHAVSPNLDRVYDAAEPHVGSFCHRTDETVVALGEQAVVAAEAVAFVAEEGEILHRRGGGDGEGLESPVEVAALEGIELFSREEPPDALADGHVLAGDRAEQPQLGLQALPLGPEPLDLRLRQRPARRVVDGHVVVVGHQAARVELAGESRQGIASHAVDPGGPEVHRGAERAVAPHPAAEALSRFENHDLEAPAPQLAGGGQTRHAGPDHEDPPAARYGADGTARDRCAGRQKNRTEEFAAIHGSSRRGREFLDDISGSRREPSAPEFPREEQ